MNEHIRKHYKEATGKDWAYDFDPQAAEKFAELIVRECMRAVESRGGMCGALASNWIKEHFGVE